MANDKTEKATPKREQEAREKGQVAKSMDLAGAAVLFAGLFSLSVFGERMLEELRSQLVGNLTAISNPESVSGQGIEKLVIEAARTTASAALPIAVACALAAAVTMAAQVQLKLSAKAIKPDFKKMNPLTNAKQVFGMNALVELVKNLLKVGSVGAVVAMIVIPQVRDAGTLVGMEPIALGSLMMSSTIKLAQAAAAAYLVIGVGDFVWQKHRTAKSMRMDLHEVKEEHKGGELPAEVRNAMRRRAMMISRARMMASVPDADVVVTNPTHYAVALKYDPTQAAPVVVAKGQDLVAARIRERATEHGVTIVPDPPLARALHASVEIDQAIPEELYEAVAQLLAFVYRTANRRIAA